MRAISNENKEAWLKARQQGIGASDAPIILGLSKWKSPYSLYLEKLGVVQPSEAESEAQAWGLLLETPMAERFHKETERPIIEPPPFTIYQHDTIDWLMATLDRWQIRPDDDGASRVPLELKTSNWALDARWKEEPPIEYLVQVQHQMAVTDTRWASIAGLIGGQKFLWMDVERDQAFIDLLVANERAFWERVILHDPPPIDSSESTNEALKALYKADNGTTVALPVEALDWDSELEGVKAEMKKLEERELLYKNRLIAAIGNATTGVLPNDVIYTMKLQNRASYTVKASSFRPLRRKAPK
jgi:putative phage-type endonuclease